MIFEVYNRQLLTYSASVMMSMTHDLIEVTVILDKTDIFVNVTTTSLEGKVCLFDPITTYKLSCDKWEVHHVVDSTMSDLCASHNYYALHHHINPRNWQPHQHSTK